MGGGVAARAARPRSRVPSASPAPGTRSCRAPPTPRPRSAPLPGPRGPRALPGARRPPARTPTAEPAADSRVRGRPPAPRRPAQLPRLLTAGAGALRGRGAAAAAELRNSLRDPTPESEPTEPRRPCLPGLYPARSLDKHFRGSGGGQGFGTGTAPGLELPGLPGGAGPLNPVPAPGLLANPCGPAGPGRRLVPLILTAVRIVPLQPPSSMEARRTQPSPVHSPGWPTVPWCFPHLLLSRLKTQLTFIEGLLSGR